MKHSLRTWLNILYKISGWVAASFIAAICFLVVCQVSLNAIDKISMSLTGTAVGLTIPSYADFTGFFLAAASFLALAHSLREGAHIRVTLVFSHFPPSIRKILEIWCVLFASSITIFFTWYTGNLTYESYSYNDLSAGMIAVPLWIPQTAMFAGLLVLSIALIDELFCQLLGNRPSYEPKKHKSQIDEA